jgi:hypothetical protein
VRNCVIFEDFLISMDVVAQLVYNSALEFKILVKEKINKKCGHAITKPSYSLGLLQWGQPRAPCDGRHSAVLYLNSQHCFKLNFVVEGIQIVR